MPLCQLCSNEKTGPSSMCPRLRPFSRCPTRPSMGQAKRLCFHSALWAEYRKRGVRIVALCPGPTETNFFKNLGTDNVPMLTKMHTPEVVVMTALHALEQGKPYAVDGRSNAFGVQVTHMAPLALTTRVFARVMRSHKQKKMTVGKRVRIAGQTSHIARDSKAG